MSTEPQGREAAPYPQMMQMIMGRWIAGAISALARLGVPDHLTSGPRTTRELAEAVGARPDLLYRLMRATASVGVLAEGSDGRFSQTPLSEVLRTDASPTLRHVAIFTSDDWQVRGWTRLADTVRTGQRPVETLFDKPLFEYLNENPEFATHFNQGMTDLSTMDAPAVAEAYDFSGIGSLTDIGGGHGLVLATILGRNTHMRGTLYDLPQVIEAARGGPTEPVRDRVTLTSGNMFESVPAGADAYIMKYIIHDWSDEECRKILEACRRGVNPGGRLLVVDSVIPTDGRFAVGKISDLEMMLFPGGQERTEDEFRALFESSGWTLSSVIPTSSHLSIIEGLPA